MTSFNIIFLNIFLAFRKRFLLMIAGMMMIMLPCFSICEKADGSAMPTVVDRFTDPDAWPDFSFPDHSGRLEVIFPNTVNADCTILRAGDRVWMVDCGTAYYADRVVEAMRLFGIDHIDCVINSHPHPDHLEALDIISDAVPVGELMICFPEDYNEYMVEAVSVCRRENIRVTSYQDGSAWEDGGVRFSARRLDDKDLDDNNKSAVIRVQYGARSLLITADIGRRTQYRMAQASDPSFLKSDILRYPHHGKEPMNDLMYDLIQPAFVVVSNAKSKFYKGCYYLDCKHVPTAYTNVSYIYLETDGKTWLAEKRESYEPQNRL